ncbi:MAG: hypothetical protein NVS2B7_35160 [Herpetosiphon sp.]
MRRRLGWLALVVMLVACGQAQPMVRSAALPQGWQAVKSGDVALGLPPAWQQLTAEQVDLPGGVERLGGANPQLAEVLGQVTAMLKDGRVQLVAFDLDPQHAGGFTTNMTVGVAPAKGASLKQLRDANVKQLSSSAAFSSVQVHDGSVGGAPALVYGYRLNVQNQAQTALELQGEQYQWLAGDRQVLVTFTTSPEQFAGLASTFKQIMETVRVGL